MAREKSKMPCNRKGLLHIFDAAGFSAFWFFQIVKRNCFSLRITMGGNWSDVSWFICKLHYYNLLPL